jgi:hypothetical protein
LRSSSAIDHRSLSFDPQVSTPLFTPDIVDSPSVRAPDFPAGLDWLHTGGVARSLSDYRGRVLVLDFWTYG